MLLFGFVTIPHQLAINKINIKISNNRYDIIYIIYFEMKYQFLEKLNVDLVNQTQYQQLQKPYMLEIHQMHMMAGMVHLQLKIKLI